MEEQTLYPDDKLKVVYLVARKAANAVIRSFPWIFFNIWSRRYFAASAPDRDLYHITHLPYVIKLQSATFSASHYQNAY